MSDLAFISAMLALASIGVAIVATHVPYWLDSVCSYWLTRHATHRVGGLTFFSLPGLNGSTFQRRTR